MPVTSAAAVVASATTMAPSETAPAPASAVWASAERDVAGQQRGLRVLVVAVDDRLRLAGDLQDQRLAVGGEVRADPTDHVVAVAFQRLAVERVGDDLPGAQVLRDHPVDQFGDGRVDLAFGVGHDLAFEGQARVLRADQVEDAPEADVLVEEAVGAFVQAVDDVLDAGDVAAELLAHLGLVPAQIGLDALDRRGVAFQQGASRSSTTAARRGSAAVRRRRAG